VKPDGYAPPAQDEALNNASPPAEEPQTDETAPETEAA
jgi:hypothetical protein